MEFIDGCDKCENDNENDQNMECDTKALMIQRVHQGRRNDVGDTARTAIIS